MSLLTAICIILSTWFIIIILVWKGYSLTVTIYPDKLLNYLQNISTQCSGYLKSSFSNATTRYGTKQLLPGRNRV